MKPGVWQSLQPPIMTRYRPRKPLGPGGSSGTDNWDLAAFSSQPAVGSRSARAASDRTNEYSFERIFDGLLSLSGENNGSVWTNPRDVHVGCNWTDAQDFVIDAR